MQVQTVNTTQRRLRILGDHEIKAIYGIPHFTHEERLEYFSLSPTEKAVLEQLHSIKSRIYYILQLGYFKARHMFFVFNLQEVEEDAKYIQEHYFPNFQIRESEITKVTRLKQQDLILELCKYCSCNVEQRQALTAKARQAARVCPKPVYVFRELMHYLTRVLRTFVRKCTLSNERPLFSGRNEIFDRDPLFLNAYHSMEIIDKKTIFPQEKQGNILFVDLSAPTVHLHTNVRGTLFRRIG